MSRQPAKELVLVLDNVRSMYNVGAIFRLSVGLGVSSLHLCGVTPRPPRAEIHKTALGMETKVPWQGFDLTDQSIDLLKKQGFQVAALEITQRSVPITQFEPHYPLALVLGHETEGVDLALLDHIDTHIHIPMTNQVKSLNVASVAAIAVWHVLA